MSEYTGFNAKQLWQMVDAARQGLQPSHDQALALDKAQQMLSGHAEALESARDQLAAKWPPESNAASAAYLSELDRLIAAVKDTALTCAVNVFHLTTVSDAIIQTHETLKPLHDEYVDNEAILASYDAEINSFSNGLARGAAKLFTSPTVDKGRQQELTQQAQQAMLTLSGAAQDGATYIKPPTPYVAPSTPQSTENNVHELGSGSSGSGAITPPQINPPAHTSRKAEFSSSTSAGDSPTASPISTGPVLSDFSPGQPLVPASPATSGSPAVPGLIPGIAAGLGVPNNSFGGRMPTGAPGEERPAGRGAFGSAEPVRGGVIGSIPGGTATAAKGTRANPFNGVIGHQPGTPGKAATRVPGRGDASPVLASHGDQRARGKTGETGRRWDPENPWEIEEGVAPVILPDSTPERNDPGPGVIGIDR